MALTRRRMLKTIATAGAAGASALGGEALARERRKVPEDAVGMLYDTTKCIGCKACVVACHEANGLPPDTRGYGKGLYDAPASLNDYTKNIIQLYRSAEGRESFMKRQCMHCVDPACTGACMIGALQKREYGIVTYERSRCIGCRYCQVACPYGVPQFQWQAKDAGIVKCELCNHRIAEGQIPACCEVCPREAVIYGTRKELLAEAKRRIEAEPRRYVPKVYGEEDGGGTQVLYVSHVPFEELGLPDLGEEGVPHVAQTVQHGVYQGFIAPAALYCVLGAVIFRNRRKSPEGEEGEEA